MANKGSRTIVLHLPKKQSLKLYTGVRVAAAVDAVLARLEDGDNRFFYVNKFALVIEAVLEHGRKQGAREVFAQLDSLKSKIPHRLPGRPRKRN